MKFEDENEDEHYIELHIIVTDIKAEYEIRIRKTL